MVLQFIFSFVCSIIFAVFLTFFLKRRGPGPFEGILYFFAIIFSFTLALTVWMRPFGPMLGGVPWLALIGTSLLITLLIAELVPHREKGQYAKTKREILAEEEKDEKVLQKEFSILIVIIFIILLAAIIYAIGFKLPNV